MIIKTKWKNQQYQNSIRNIDEKNVQEISITKTSRSEWAKKKQSRCVRKRRISERLFQRSSLMNWNDILNTNDRSQQDEDSIKDCINDEARKKQSNLNSAFTTKHIAKKERNHCIRNHSNQAMIQSATSESISSIQRKKPMSSNHSMKRWWMKLRLHDSKQMMLKKQEHWWISFKNWKLNMNFLYQSTITMNNYFEEMLYWKKRRENEFDQNAKLEKKITDLEIELSNVQSQKQWALKEIKRLTDCNANLQRHIDKQLADLQIYRNKFWCLHD